MHERILAIYDADFTVLGELTYAIGKLSGTRSCALCDISHGLNPLGRRHWRGYCKTRPEVEWLHRNDLSSEDLGKLPCELPCVVLLEPTGAFTALLDKDALTSCNGDLTTFDQRLSITLAERAVNDGVARES